MTGRSELSAALRSFLPLSGTVLSGDGIILKTRPVDMRWYYDGVVPISVVGFNPLGTTVYCGNKSHIRKFLDTDADLGSSDLSWAIYEICFLVHDYLHLWAVNWIAQRRPLSVKRYKPGYIENLRDVVFVLLVSEAVATVCLDYWLLSRLDDLRGSEHFINIPPLTTSFRKADLVRARAVSPTFTLESVEFFRFLTQAYCTGLFEGFENACEKDIDCHAQWIRKEKRVSKAQRNLMARWVCHLTGAPLDLAAELSKITVETPWRRNLIDELGDYLWFEFRNIPGPLQLTTVPFIGLEIDEIAVPYDLRFTDILNIPDSGASMVNSSTTPRQFGYLAAQFVSAFDRSDFPSFSSEDFDRAVTARDFAGLQSIFGPLPRCRGNPNSSVHLFFPN